MRIVDGQRGSHVCWYDLAGTCGVCFLSQQFLPLESWPTCVSFEVPWHTCESEEEAERETSLCVSPRALRRPKRPRHRPSTSVQRRVAFPFHRRDLPFRCSTLFSPFAPRPRRASRLSFARIAPLLAIASVPSRIRIRRCDVFAPVEKAPP